jgi:hypothetical protein
MVKGQALARQERRSEDSVMSNICRLPETPGGWDELAGPPEEETPFVACGACRVMVPCSWGAALAVPLALCDGAALGSG